METKDEEDKSSEVAEIKITYSMKQEQKIHISSSKDAFEILYPLFDQETIGLKEEFYMLLLNRNNKVLGWYKLSSGGTTGTVADPKLIFMTALKANAHALILCHNHPSGNLQPSEQDKQLTLRIKSISTPLEIQLLDHLIVIPDKAYYSFADEGVL